MVDELYSVANQKNENFLSKLFARLRLTPTMQSVPLPIDFARKIPAATEPQHPILTIRDAQCIMRLLELAKGKLGSGYS
jgi:hypothetical protein